jgi:hypothetical protein
MRRSSRTVDVGCSSPEPETNWRTDTVQPPSCIGRYEGTDRFLGRSEPLRSLCNRRDTGDRASIRVWCRHVLSVPADRNQVSTRDQMLTTPAPNKRKIFADRNSSSLDKRGPHKGSAEMRQRRAHSGAQSIAPIFCMSYFAHSTPSMPKLVKMNRPRLRHRYLGETRSHNINTIRIATITKIALSIFWRRVRGARSGMTCSDCTLSKRDRRVSPVKWQ